MKTRLAFGTGMMLATALGCDAQVGEEYTGEPIFSFQGTVLVSDQRAARDLEPVLLAPRHVDDGSEFGRITYDIVRGEVTGHFPARFRFDVMQPPPSDQLRPLGLPGASGRAWFSQIALLPPGQEDLAHTERFEGECTFTADEVIECTQPERACHADGRCREREFRCAYRPCELVQTLGEPVTERLSVFGHTRCEDGVCHEVDIGCDTETCQTNVYLCDGYEGVLSDPFNGHVEVCTLAGESGDSSVLTYDDLDTLASGYALSYLTDDLPSSPFGPLSRGYHVTHASIVDVDTWKSTLVCEAEFVIDFIAAYNREHGTSLHWTELPDGDSVRMRDERIATCGEVFVSDLVEDPIADPLLIELGPPVAAPASAF